MPEKTRTYRRELYAAYVTLRKPRPEAATPHVRDVMTRWIRRCVRDEPIVTGVARLETSHDVMTGQKWLRAEAHAYQNVLPEDVGLLENLVDTEGGQMVVANFPKNALPWHGHRYDCRCAVTGVIEPQNDDA